MTQIRFWKEFEDWCKQKGLSDAEYRQLRSIVLTIATDVKNNKDKVICSCKPGEYCNVECNL